MPDGVICGSLRRFQDLRMAMEWPRIYGRRRMNSENQLTQKSRFGRVFPPPQQAGEGATPHMFKVMQGRDVADPRCAWLDTLTEA
jgi:hypothetical protein